MKIMLSRAVDVLESPKFGLPVGAGILPISAIVQMHEQIQSWATSFAMITAGLLSVASLFFMVIDRYKKWKGESNGKEDEPKEG